ncbi:hypothetical protein P9112_011381 [Eukaryota sp. TZLM1-RC]
MVRTFTSSEGFTISIGENAADNDKIRKAAHQNDLWFHLNKLSSAHAILHCGKAKSLPRVSIHETAQLVKYFSARHLVSVTIIYCKTRYVRGGGNVGSVQLKKATQNLNVSEDLRTLSYFGLE